MKNFFWAVIMMFGMWTSAATRPPAVAGAFYPGDAAELRAQVAGYLENVETRPAALSRAIVVPHAGYVYSGAVAAEAFAGLRGSDAKRVLLLGPSHRASFTGGSLPAKGTTAFATPLGEIALDEEAIATLRRSGLFDGPPKAHDREHCLEVELPFLQIVVPQAKIVPILVGHSLSREMAREMAKTLSELLDENTVIVVSTDFSHHGRNFSWAPYPVDRDIGNKLIDLGKATGERVADIDSRGFWEQVEVSGDTVCGKRPVAVLTELLDHAFKGHGEVLDVTTSGHVVGGFDQSVTYVSIGFEGEWKPWAEDQASPVLGELSAAEKKAILQLARATFNTHIVHDASLALWFDTYPVEGNFEAFAGAFVTVHNTGEKARTQGRLRACMGVIEARKPLVDAIISSATSASHDPRFPELTAEELLEAHLEVSVLSPTRRVDSPSEIEVGTHGVVFRKRGRSAVFLPQVATEQGWDRATMLSHLARKAGLSPDAWKSDATFEVFTAQVFAEEQ